MLNGHSSVAKHLKAARDHINVVSMGHSYVTVSHASNLIQ